MVRYSGFQQQFSNAPFCETIHASNEQVVNDRRESDLHVYLHISKYVCTGFKACKFIFVQKSTNLLQTTLVHDGKLGSPMRARLERFVKLHSIFVGGLCEEVCTLIDKLQIVTQSDLIYKVAVRWLVTILRSETRAGLLGRQAILEMGDLYLLALDTVADMVCKKQSKCVLLAFLLDGWSMVGFPVH